MSLKATCHFLYTKEVKISRFGPVLFASFAVRDPGSGGWSLFSRQSWHFHPIFMSSNNEIKQNWKTNYKTNKVQKYFKNLLECHLWQCWKEGLIVLLQPATRGSWRYFGFTLFLCTVYVHKQNDIIFFSLLWHLANNSRLFYYQQLGWSVSGCRFYCQELRGFPLLIM